ncbi:PASTA domain-containing protein [Pedobacter sp. BS3]|uniref:PASTA domain-containing protein n=1 Tax=Pedobacter sp. BS3 TaxID=2567937 RepID=UPI0011EBB9BD|nr:PASTA domain-containing protein [Pedobacter sp. BS3]TZF83684.1 PASTA domain-containing protein [Pedobacter sp. BS3]
MSKLFLYLKTKTFRNNLLVAIGSVIGFVLIVFFCLRFYTRHGEGLPVPKLKGLSVENAIQLLESQGFKYQIDSVFQMDKAPGLVVEQDPDPNTNVKNNRTIYLTIITRQAPNVGFPDIQNITFLEAQAILSNYGLKIGDTTYISDIARDRVLAAKFGGEPVEKGQMLPKGSKVDLVLGDGKGASEVDLPDLKGLTLSEAIFSLKGASLSLGTVMYEGAITDSLNAHIIRQYPALSDSLSKVAIGTKVDVVVSN